MNNNNGYKLELLVCIILLHLSQWTAAQLKNDSMTGLDEMKEAEERKRTENVVKLAATDQLNSEIITNLTRAYLSCESGEMIVKINFTEPFRGVGYADYDRSSPCKFYGDGGRYYEMRLPLKGCGTKQEAPRVFINNIIVRFHRSLELEEDEIKTIICRYPPPLAPPPPSIIAPILEPTPPVAVIVPAKLSEVELLLIICALLFLTLLLLGVGIGYYCLKRRNIKVVRKRKIISAPGSEITIIEPIRIPRVTAPPSTGSSDYPSSSSEERRSVVSEESTVRHDHYKYDNFAFIPEPYPLDVEKEESISSFPPPVIHKPNITKQDLITTILSTQHFIDEDVYNTTHKRTTTQLYKKVPKIEKKAFDDYYLTKEDQTDIDEDITNMKSIIIPPKLSKKGVDDYYSGVKETIEIDEDTNKKLIKYPQPKITVKKIDDLFVTNISETETTEHITKQSKETIAPPPPPPPPPPILDKYRYPMIMTTELPETRTIWDTTTSTNQLLGSTTIDSSTTRIRDLRQTKLNKIIDTFERPPPYIDGVDRLTPEVKTKLRTVITTDQVFRTLIIESTTTEEYIRISRDYRYESLFEPPTWETIIRILSLPDILSAPISDLPSDQEVRVYSRYRKSQHLRKGSLPSLVSEPISELYGLESIKSRRTSRSGSILDNELRSLTEEDVDFARGSDRDSLWSQDTGFSPRHRRAGYLNDVPTMPSFRQSSNQMIMRTTNLSEYVVPRDYPYHSSYTRDSPQLEALSLDIPSHTVPSYMPLSSSYVMGRAVYERASTHQMTASRQIHERRSNVDDREEIKSMTETDVYDWLRS